MNSNLQKNEDKKSGTRLLSLDTLRGFDMLFIMGQKQNAEFILIMS